MVTLRKTLALALLFGFALGPPAWAGSDPVATGSEASQVELDEEWRYDTGYFFGLTRGLPESGVSERCRPYVMVLTVPLDIAILPGAALAGLFG